MVDDLESLSNAMGNVSKSDLKARSELLGYIPIH